MFITQLMCHDEQREFPGFIIACLATWTQFSSSDCQRTAFYVACQGSRQGSIPFVDAIILDNQLANELRSGSLSSQPTNCVLSAIRLAERKYLRSGKLQGSNR